MNRRDCEILTVFYILMKPQHYTINREVRVNYYNDELKI